MNDQLISWLMDAAAKAQGRGGGVPMGQQPSPFMPTPDALMAQREQEAKQILGQAYAPGQVSEAPLTPRDKFANVITGLADMLSAKAHAYNAAPPPDALNELRRRREERMMRDYAVGEEGKRAGLAAKQRVAEYELGQIEGEKDRSGKLSEAKIKAENDLAIEKEKAEQKAFERYMDLRVDAAKAGYTPGANDDEPTLLAGIAEARRREDARKNREKPEKPEKPDNKLRGIAASTANGMVKGLPPEVDKNGQEIAPAIPPMDQRLEAGESPEALLDEYVSSLAGDGIWPGTQEYEDGVAYFYDKLKAAMSMVRNKKASAATAARSVAAAERLIPKPKQSTFGSRFGH